MVCVPFYPILWGTVLFKTNKNTTEQTSKSQSNKRAYRLYSVIDFPTVIFSTLKFLLL